MADSPTGPFRELSSLDVLGEGAMPRIRVSLYTFCLEKASEALRNAEMSDIHRDYEYWLILEAKWNDLADFYYGDHCRQKSASIDRESAGPRVLRLSPSTDD
jgi:hypothetical protein